MNTQEFISNAELLVAYRGGFNDGSHQSALRAVADHVALAVQTSAVLDMADKLDRLSSAMERLADVIENMRGDATEGDEWKGETE